jgi:RecB family exonuclease
MPARVILKPWSQLDPTAYLKGRLVVTPNPRAAERLGAHPMTIEKLGRKVLAPSGLTAAPALLAGRLMEDVAEAVLGGRDPIGMASAMAGMLRQLFRAGADLQHLEAIGALRTRPLASLGLAYRARLRQDNLLDGAEVLWEAARRAPTPRRLLVHGYPRLGRDELAFLATIADENSVLMLPYEPSPLYQGNLEAAGYLEGCGWQVERHGALEAAESGPLAFGPDIVQVPETQALAFAHMEAEVRGVLARVKDLLAAGARPQDITLVARDDAFYGPTVLAVAWEYGVPVSAFYSVPVAQTLLGAWLQLLTEAVQHGLPYETTLRLLGHPYGPELPTAWWAAVRQAHPAGLLAWQPHMDLSPLSWPAEDTRGAWATRLVQLLHGFEIAQKAGAWPRERLALEEVLDGLGILGTPADEVVSQSRFIQELQGALGTLTVPAQPGRGGVELHTPLSLFGARYPHVFVLGMAADHLPARVSDDPMLDFHERKALTPHGIHLESPAEAARRETLSFASLLQVPSGSLTLSYPKLMADRPTLPSVYLQVLGWPLVAASAMPPASHEEARRGWLGHDHPVDDALVPQIRVALGVERRREGPEAWDDFDGVVGVPVSVSGRSFSATQITTLAQCPFRWFAAYVLRLAEPEEAEEDLSPSLRGSLYHRVLELSIAERPPGADLRAHVHARLAPSFTQAETELAVTRLPAWDARRAEHLRNLKLAVDGVDFACEGTEVLGVEVPFTAEWQGFQVRGIIDRVDRTPEGLVLIDYKTSATPPKGGKDDDGRAKLDIQLPIYMQAAAPALHPGDSVADAFYYSLTKGKVLKRANLDVPALEALGARMRAHLDTGSFPVDPDVDGAACTYCDHALMCRKGPRLSRKGASA